MYPKQLKRYQKSVQAIIAELFDVAAEVHECYTFEEISDLTGISVSTLFNWYHGKTRYPRLDTIWRFADAVGKYVLVTDPVPSLHVGKAA